MNLLNVSQDRCEDESSARYESCDGFWKHQINRIINNTTGGNDFSNQIGVSSYASVSETAQWDHQRFFFNLPENQPMRSCRQTSMERFGSNRDFIDEYLVACAERFAIYILAPGPAVARANHQKPFGTSVEHGKTIPVAVDLRPERAFLLPGDILNVGTLVSARYDLFDRVI